MEPDYFAIRRFRAEVPLRPFWFPTTTDRDGWIASRVKHASSILEVGAGERPFVLHLPGFAGTFRTMDVSPLVSVDYRSLDGIEERFDAVVMREVIEHLPRPLFYDYLDRITGALLKPDGVLAITTPNPWCPPWFLGDYTHVSHWPPADLYGLLRYYGFGKVEIARIIWPSRLLFLKRLYWAMHSRFYDLDFAGSYIAFASRR